MTWMKRAAALLVASALYVLMAAGAVLTAAGALGCDGRTGSTSVDGGDSGGTFDGGPDAGSMLPDTPGARMWAETIQHTLSDWCGPCHVGNRFAWASMERRGPFFTPEETARNYERFLD